MTPIQYAVAACETLMRKFEARMLPPARFFHYHAGVFLSGMGKTYELTKDERFFDYARAYVDSLIDEQGNITNYNPGRLDDLQASVLIFPIYARDPQPRYKEALDAVGYYIKHYPRCENGGYWHKEVCHGEMWLDGLYMGGPLSCMYGRTFDKPEYYGYAAEQATLMRQVTRDEKTGLWYHAWDSKPAPLKCSWADPVTGLAPEFWGRSIGWVPVAMLEESDYIPEDRPEWKTVTDIAVELLEAVCKYQHPENGLWYQVVDKADQPGNWPEISCSCLYVSALFKAVRKGLMGEKYLEIAKRGYEAVIDTIRFDENGILIGGVCVGTGVGDYEHYCKRPTSVNDLHGVGAFLLMCAEAAHFIKE